MNHVKSSQVKKSLTSRKKSTSAPSKQTEAKKEMAATYNEFKEFEGHQYTGMKVGRSHKWYYDKGEWRETKITPDLWEISYAVTKRRAGHAPEGSGVPVGSAYHWYILAHQNVRKINANDYTTSLMGLKYKLAHQRAGAEKWSASSNAQRKHLADFLRQMITQLEMDPVPVTFEFDGKNFKGEAFPLLQTCMNEKCFEYDITLNGEYVGIIHRAKNGWKMKNEKAQRFVTAIGKEIDTYYSL
jgi:hypothetical protein